MPSSPSPRHALHTPAPPHARRRTAVAALVVGVALGAAGAPALAAPITPPYPTVFISQVISGGVTTMRSVEQSRLAGAGQGGVTITSLAPNGTAGFAYNAVGFRAADNYLYGVSSDVQLVRIEHDGTATKLGAIRTAGGTALGTALYSGTFGADPDILYARPTGASSTLYLVDVTTARYTTRTLSASVNVNDFSYAGGYLWGVDGSTATKRLVRIDPATGVVTSVDVTSVFPAADGSSGYSTGYGAAWTYGNGNLAFSYNATGNITQIRINDLAAATPQVRLVSTIAGPSTSQNDGATTPASPTDLRLVVDGPEPSAPSSPISWTIDVVNAGPAGSSGATFSYPVPAGVTGVTLPVGCALVAQTVQCVSGQLAVGQSDTYVFSGVSPAAAVVSSTSTVTIVGNEADASDNTATLVVAPLPLVRTSTGVGTAVQQVAVAVPDGGTLRLLDGSTPVTSLVVPGAGTYAVSGSTLTFTPELGYAGTAPAAPFEVRSGVERGTGTYTATVQAPAGPTAAGLTSTDESPRPQTVGLTVPPSGTVTLLDGDGAPATTVGVAGGTYTLDGSTVTFTPDALFVGQAPAVTYRVTDPYGQSATATYTPTVTAPAGPSPAPLTSDGVGTTVQSPASAVTVPAGGAVTLLDAGGAPAASVTVPGQGTYGLDAGVLTFSPVLGFSGAATPVTFRVTDAYGQSATATYTPTVHAPAAPTPTAPTTTGEATTPQATTVVAPAGGSVTLLDADGLPATTVTVAGQGTYTLDPATGVVTFTPVLGFQGQATPVALAVTDAYGQTAVGTYTPTVTPPPAPAAASPTTTGPVVTDQTVTLTVPAGGTVTLPDAADGTTLDVPGVGTYVLDPATGVVVFTPEAGFAGPTDGVRYAVTDAYGQTVVGTYTPTVTPPAPPVADPGTSEGIATDEQDVVVTVPPGGAVTLLDGDGTPVTTVDVPGQGTYVLDPSTGTVTFTPVLGFQGTAGGVDVRVTDAYGQSATATYTPTVRPPAPPAPADLTSQGTGGVPQAPDTTVAVPVGGSVHLVGPGGAAVTELDVPGEGGYVLDPATGALSFTPVLGFQGTATGVQVQVTDAYGQTGAARYTPAVTAPPGPAVADLTSSGPAVTAQQVGVAVPTGGTVTLLDAGGAPVTTVVVPGEGTYVLDPATGQVVFTPVAGFSGLATPVTVRVTDAYGQTDTATWTPTVVPPAAPVAVPTTTTGVGTTPQVSTPAVPASGTITLLDAADAPATTVEVTGQGTYVLVDGAITFTAVHGFAGTATPVAFRVTDLYGQSSSATYTPTVLPPAGPVATDRVSTGPVVVAQQTVLDVPAGGAVTLIDAAGDPVTAVTVPGQGGYVLDPATGELVFTPEPTFAGAPTPVAFRVTDAYGQSTDGTYSPTVTPPAPPVAPPAQSSGVGVQPQRTTVTVPDGGSVTLLDAGGQPVTSVTVDGQGTYTIDPVTGEVAFEPVLGFVGDATPAAVRVTDVYGGTTTTTATATVLPPAPPVAAPYASTGLPGARQEAGTRLTVPVGGTVVLVDADGRATDRVTVPGQGAYALDVTTGVLSFVPEAGFTGAATPVVYRVTDAYAQVAQSTYRAEVLSAVDEPAAAAPAVLARTGGGSLALLGAGAALVVGGVLLLLTGRLRRQ